MGRGRGEGERERGKEGKRERGGNGEWGTDSGMEVDKYTHNDYTTPLHDTT